MQVVWRAIWALFSCRKNPYSGTSSKTFMIHTPIFWEPNEWPTKMRAKLNGYGKLKELVAALHLERLCVRTPERSSVMLSAEAGSGVVVAYPNDEFVEDWCFLIVRVHTRQRESQYHGWITGAELNAVKPIPWPIGSSGGRRKVVAAWELHKGWPDEDRSQIEAAARCARESGFARPDVAGPEKPDTRRVAARPARQGELDFG